MKTVTIKSSQLGTCWTAAKFCGGECDAADRCVHKEKGQCKAYAKRVKIVKTPYRHYANGQLITEDK